MEKIEGRSSELETCAGGGQSSYHVDVVGGVSRAMMGVIDLTLRIVCAAGTLGSAVVMATANQSLPFFSQFLSQFIQFTAHYNDLPTFTFFVIANSVACGYLVLISIPLSIYHTLRPSSSPNATTTRRRIILLLFDTVMLAVVTSGASAAAAIVYLAYKGNGSANWPAICQQFDSFCSRISGSLIASFAAALFLILIILTSSIASHL